MRRGKMARYCDGVFWIIIGFGALKWDRVPIDAPAGVRDIEVTPSSRRKHRSSKQGRLRLDLWFRAREDRRLIGLALSPASGPATARELDAMATAAAHGGTATSEAGRTHLRRALGSIIVTMLVGSQASAQDAGKAKTTARTP
jgi:hypothetical protein